jgi:hypothetical protein
MLGRAALVLLAASVAFLPLPPALVERIYSANLYLRLQALLTPVSNRVPFALFDGLLVLVPVAWLLALAVDIRRVRGGAMRVAARLLLRTLVWGSALYLVFLAVWGLNYRRTRLVDKLEFDLKGVSAAAAVSAGATSVAALNALSDPARGLAEAETDPTTRPLAIAFDRVQGELGSSRRAVAGRPKATLLAPYFRRAGVAGMTDPFFLETLVASDLLPIERPFVIAHEWAHLAGFADESEANFVGWLTCLRGSADDQYSGWLFLYGELALAVGVRDRAQLAARLAPGPRADLQAIARRVQQQVSPTISAAGWRANDLYLKANRVESGAASYAEVVRLVLGVKFGPDWTPRLTEHAP